MSTYQTKKANSKPVILVVDDQSEIRRLLHFYLKDSYIPVLVNNAEQGVAYLASHAVDLVLMDINLGIGMSGIEAVKVIRRHVKYKSLPIVMMTASTQDQNKTDSFKAGCSDYMVKPIYKEGVIKVIDHELAQKKGPF